MSSTRLRNDTCAYKKQLLESTSPLNYALYTGKYENCSKCRVEFGIVGGNNVSLFNGNLVDLESDLRGQTRPASRCPSMKYQPSRPNGSSQNLVHQPSCQMFKYPKVPNPPPVQQHKC